MPSPSRKPKKKRPSSPPTNRGSASRIIGDGEMAELTRAFAWEKTSLGGIKGWPDTLVTTVNVLLASRHPMFLWWGPELIQFYNDGYRPSIRADKHPAAVGQRGAKCWPEIWPIIGPQIESVMNEGRSTWHKNQLVPINRDGKLEEVYWTYSYSPVRDSKGTVQGTLVVCSETTEEVLSERRLKTLLAVTASERSASQLQQSQTLGPYAQDILKRLEQHTADIPFAALYQVSAEQAECLGTTTAGGGVVDALQPTLTKVTQSQEPVLADLQRLTRSLICDPWPEPVTRAYALPLALHGLSVPAILVFGISPRLPFDEAYATFLQVVGTKIAGLLQSELQRLELLRAAARFRSLTAANPFGMMIGTLDGSLQYVNPVFLKRLGYSESELASGKVRWDILTPPEYALADADAVQQLRATGRCSVYEKVFVAKDGRRVPILLGASVIDSLEGDAEVVAFVTELTPLKMAEEALQKANDQLERKVAERTAALQTEIAERKRMETSFRELSGRLLTTQDEERRRMARELHDNAGQILAALAMNVSAISTAAAGADERTRYLASEAKVLAEDLSKEIRTLSYLLHPPLLDEVGLESALRWYVDGFSERSKIQVELVLPETMERLPREIELVLFRVVQESLTNVHRHSGSATAKIQLSRAGTQVGVEISDRGKGIPAERQREMTGARAGVGLRGMEERVRQFGGTLQIASDENGTRVSAGLPVTEM